MAMLVRQQFLRHDGLHRFRKVKAGAASFSSIPIIDISVLVNSKNITKSEEDAKFLKVVQQIDDACRNVGFFYVKGHGVPVELTDQVRRLGREFFKLPLEEKMKVQANGDTGYRGYQALGVNITKGAPDLHEAIDFLHDYNGKFPQSMQGHPLLGRNTWPALPTAFRPVYEQYLTVLQDLGRTVMQAIGFALAGSRDTFEGNKAGDPFWLLRMIGYPPFEQNVTEVGCGEHTDYGLLTLVNQDNGVRALQVKNQAGEWIWADPIPGAFVVNIGEMLKIWSNGVYKPTVHRVLNDKSKYRVSVPYFYEPNFDAVVEPLDACKNRTGGVAKYSPVVYGEYLTAKVLTNLNI